MKLTNKQMINMHTTLIEIGNRGDIDPGTGCKHCPQQL